MSENLITFHCPHCDSHLQIPAVLAGVTGPCPDCEETITAPGHSALLEEELEQTATYTIQAPPSLPAGRSNPGLPSIYVPQLTKPLSDEEEGYSQAETDKKLIPIPLSETITAPNVSHVTKTKIPERPRSVGSHQSKDADKEPPPSTTPKYPPLVITPYDTSQPAAPSVTNNFAPPPIPSLIGEFPPSEPPSPIARAYQPPKERGPIMSIFLTGSFIVFALAIILSILAHLQLLPVPESLKDLPFLRKEQTQKTVSTPPATPQISKLQPQAQPTTPTPDKAEILPVTTETPTPEAVIETFEPPIETFESPIETFESPIETFESPIETFESPIETFESPIETFESPIETFEPPPLELPPFQVPPENDGDLVIPVEVNEGDVPAFQETMHPLAPDSDTLEVRETPKPQENTPELLPQPEPEPNIVKVAGYDDSNEAAHSSFDRELWSSGARAIENFLTADSLDSRKAFMGASRYTDSQLATFGFDKSMTMPIRLTPLRQSEGLKKNQTNLFYTGIWRSPATEQKDIVAIQVTQIKGAEPTIHVDSFIDLRLSRLSKYLNTPSTKPQIFYALAAAYPSLKPSTSKSLLTGKYILKIYDHPSESEIGKVYLDPHSSVGLEFMKDNSFGKKRLCKLTLQWNLASPAEFFIGVQSISALNWSQQ